ncbi:deoxynucleotide monophosphate kinase family protein [Streptomyces chrestomyceticus]|uniref:deoxynucleotide monophosphate kinase family protein n=1 Tax=Streptomyces chrestomyceticus TaxID=68185 RepID=UPI0037946B9C
MRDIALMGRARSGKDTVGARLEARYNYVPLAFADPLKDTVLEIDPWVVYDLGEFGGKQSIRLSDLIEHVGWERAKDEYYEVRRLLQSTGQSIRDRDPDYWLRLMLSRVDTARNLGRPVVLTDVRYPNEADALKRLGFRLVRVERPSLGPLPPFSHQSERSLIDYSPAVTIVNSGTLADLQALADSIAF